MTLFDPEPLEVPQEPAVHARARTCAVCSRPRPVKGLEGDAELGIDGNRRAWVCSEACRLYYTGGWRDAAPWRPRG